MAYLRRKARTAPLLARRMLEQHSYRRAMYAFMAATADNPGILIDADIDATSVVVDAGAFVGEWSEKISQRYGARIYAFEPNPSVQQALTRRLAEHPNVQTFAFGLGRTDHAAVLTLAGPGSTVYGLDPELETVGVEIRDVTTVLDDLELEHVDLLKVNIEGSEYDLLDRLIETGWLPRIRLVSVQFHEWHPRAYRRRRVVRRALRRTHREQWCYPWVWELWARIGQAPE